MPRRRGGREYKIRQLLAIALGNKPQKRGNNKSLRVNVLKSEFAKSNSHMSHRAIRVVSDVVFTGPVVLLDSVTLSFIRIIGSLFPKKSQTDRSSESGSDASTLILDKPEIITID